MRFVWWMRDNEQVQIAEEVGRQTVLSVQNPGGRIPTAQFYRPPPIGKCRVTLKSSESESISSSSLSSTPLLHEQNIVHSEVEEVD